MFTNKIDSAMEQGIKIQGELITNPDNKQRASFVVMNFISLATRKSRCDSASCA